MVGYTEVRTQDLWIKSPMLYLAELYTLKFIKLTINNYNAKRIRNAIINANKAIASVKANPKIAVLNNSSFSDGFLEIPITNAPNTVPIPTPAPASPIEANPAPINLAACNNIEVYCIY